MDVKELTLRLAAADGTSGDERGATALMAELLQPYGAVRFDPLGNLICTLRPAEGKAHHYVIDGHTDEIGLIVTGITDEGFLRVSNIGGIDRRLIAASEVYVHGKSVLPGFVASTPPHLQEPGEKKTAKIEDVLVDIGMDKESAEAQVSLGDRITFKGPGREMLGGLIISKALDDRAACAVAIRVAELLKDVELDCGVSIALATREEIGIVGAHTSCFSLKPTHAFTVDVTFAHTPDVEKHRTCTLGKGPTVMFCPFTNREFTTRVVQIAKAHDIPVQVEASGGRSTGTDADGIAVTGEGVAVCGIGLPLTYMHMPIEQLDPNDLETAAQLIVNYLKEEEGRKC